MSKEIPQLHFIRAASMVGIFLHHLYMGNAPLRQAHADTILGHAFVDLALGVVVFNVMTSFLLTLPFVGAHPAPLPRLAEFAPKRLVRLCPQYYLAIIFVVLANAVVYRVTSPGAWLPSALAHVFFVDPLRLSSFMSNTAAWWWLGLLVQFTLCYPLLLKLFHKYGPARLTIAVTLVVWPATELLKMWGRAAPDGIGGAVAFLSTFNLPARLPEFLIGMWMAKLWKDCPGRTWIVDKHLAGLIFGACALCLAVSSFPAVPTPWFAGLAWTLALFVLLFALPQSARWGANPKVLWLSLSSYGIYLMHQPILSYLDLAVDSFWPWARFFCLLALAWLVTVRETLFLEKASAWVMARLSPRRK